ncbi:glycosyltransferase family 2 protein [Nocardioides bigeumensis]|uniref:glycosyltransferase family 2 protein n=1 Tax=Nocardioides bigeumensis TaxID=433657 RepID=UPI0031DADC40
MTSAVVTIAHGRHDHLLAQHGSLAMGSRVPDLYVVVAMDDAWIESWRPEGTLRPTVVAMGSDPRGLPLAAARNAGFAVALERGADVVIGLDVDCLAGRDLVAAYADAAVREAHVAWTGPVTYLKPRARRGYDLAVLAGADDPHPARPAPEPGDVARRTPPELFWSLSFACHRDLWQRVGGFCEEYVGYGAEDTDFGRQLEAGGIELASEGSARAYHQHHDSEVPPRRHVPDLLRNGAVYARRWGSWPMEGWFETLAQEGLVVRDGADGWAPPPGVPGTRPPS